MAAISAPLVKSYKRLTPRGMIPQISWAPVYITYGRNKKTAIISLIAAIVIFLSVLTTNVMVVYSATMSYLSIFNKHKFWKPALVIGVITIFGALLKDWLLEQFQEWLILSGVVFIPLVSIMIVDYYLLKKSRYDALEIVTGEKKTYWYLGGYNIA